MGESYRGLTIKFGGDTTSLQQALRNANAIISVTQSELRKVNSALKLDPADVVSLNVKMSLLKERSEGVYEKMKMLGTEIRQLGYSESGASQLAVRFEQTSKNVSETTNRVNKLNAELAKTKDKMIAMAESADIGRLFNESREPIESAIAQFKALGGECEKLVVKYDNLRAAHKSAMSEQDTAKEQSRIAKLATELVKTTSEAKKLREEFKSMQGLSIFNESEASAYNSRMRELDSILGGIEGEAKRMWDALNIDPKNVDAAKKYVSALKDEVALTEEKTKLLKERMDSLKDSGIDAAGKSAREARQEFVKAANTLSEWNEKVGAVEAKMSDIKADMVRIESEGKGITDEYRQLESELSKVSAELVKVREKQNEAKKAFDSAQAVTEVKKLEVEIAEATAKLNKYETALNGIGKAISVNASTFTTLGMALSQNITPYLMMAVTYSVDAAQEIDAAYRDMRKTVNGTEEDFEALKDAAMDFASTHVTSADQILEIEAMGGQMGLLVDELDVFAETVANLNVATNISDASEMAEILGQLSNIMSDLTTDKFPQFGDALVRLGNNNAALESDILEVTSRIGSMGSICDMTTPEILAWATAIAATGQNSEAAGTAISNTMSDIENAVASGGDSLQQFADIAGMSADQFAEKWSTKPSDAMQSFIEGLARIDEEGGSVDATLESLGITGVRQKQALQGLAQTVDTLDDALTMSKDAWNGVSDEWGEAGDAANEAAKKSEGFSGQLSILQNNAQMLGAEFAESLAPVIGVVNSAMQGLYDITKEMPDGIKLLIVAIAGLVAAVGPFATIIGPVLTTMNTVNSTAANINKTLGKVEGTAGKTGKAMTVLKGSMAALAAAIAAIVVSEIISYFAEMAERARNLKNATEGLDNAMEDARASIESSSDSAARGAKSYGNLAASVSSLKEKTDEAIESQSELADSIEATWTDVYSDISLAESYAETIKTLAGNCSEGSGDIDVLKTAIDGYNDVTGSSVEITNEVSGAINLTSDQLDENTKKWKENAEAQAKQEIYVDLYKQRYSNIQKLNEATETYNALLAIDTTGYTAEEYQALNGQIQNTAKSMDDLTKLIDADNKEMSELSGNAEEAAGTVANLGDAMKSAADKLGMSLDQFKEYASKMGVYGEEGMTSFTQAITDGTDPAIAAIGVITGMTQEQFYAARDAMGLSGEEGVLAFQNAINAGTDPIVAAAMTLTGLSNEQFYAAANAMGYSGEDGVSRFATEITNGQLSAEEAARAVKDAAVNEVESGADEAAAAGDNFGSNFASNIGNYLGAAANAAAELAKSAWTALFGELEINSPSKVAIRAAKGFAKEGFIDTIADYENEAYITAALLGKSTVEGLDDGILAMRDAAQANVYRTLSSGTASGASSTTNNTRNITVTMNVTADSTTTLESLIRQAERAGMAYGR